MNKERTKGLIYACEDYLSALKYEMAKDKQYYSYMNEKLSCLENDIRCLRNEIETLKEVK